MYNSIKHFQTIPSPVLLAMCSPFIYLKAIKSLLSAVCFFTLFFCPTLFFRWWVGGWQQCTTTCGSEGIRKRTVLCVRTVSGEERVLHPVECKHLLKPKPVVPCNRDVPCGLDWAVGNWEEVLFCVFYSLIILFSSSSFYLSDFGLTNHYLF